MKLRLISKKLIESFKIKVSAHRRCAETFLYHIQSESQKKSRIKLSRKLLRKVL